MSEHQESFKGVGADSSFHNLEPEYERIYLDGTQPHPMFLNVQIEETEQGVGFSVPKRIINTPNNNKWIFDIYGGRKWFKERDDYGNFRFTKSGDSLWIPHLYPFEETDEHGLPIIYDRERCAVKIRLQPFVTSDDINTQVNIVTANATLLGQEAPESYNPYFIRYFNEFTFVGKPLISQSVTYPKIQWPTFADYLRDKGISKAEQTEFLMSQKAWPDEFLAQKQPEPWYVREPSGFGGFAFGEMFVPIDDLRHGINADILFPCFKP